MNVKVISKNKNGNLKSAFVRNDIFTFMWSL